jgi:hypothetical protein
MTQPISPLRQRMIDDMNDHDVARAADPLFAAFAAEGADFGR